ncbi:EF2563 family selenium-dependent molybdenum hydroxylase system protein [bacterium]|nr:EF2563 family selenium-dependent molybdenum hydroxylase system protein [bacterium]
MDRLPLIVIRGGGDLASGVAYRLFRSGFPILMTEVAHPRMVRCSVSFGEAILSGSVFVEDVQARLIEGAPVEIESVLRREFIGVMIDPEGQIIDKLSPRVIVDARMLKVELEDQRRSNCAVIGLGPGFTAGENVDYVIETMRGITLGKVIDRGSAIANTGTPGVVAGESVRRLIRAPISGTFKAIKKLGDIVEAEDVVGYVDGVPVKVAIAGRLRGLIRDNIFVNSQEKLGDCDPRGEKVDIYTISDKSRAIGGGVLEAAMRYLFAGKDSKEEGVLFRT